MAILISKNHDRMNNGTGIPPVCFQNAQSCQPETHRRGRLCHKTAALLLVLLFSVGSPGNARAQTISREYSLKAAFLLNFAQFTAWPLTAFAHTNSPFVIGILGDDPFGSALDETLRGESWNGHPFVVRRNINLESACDCQLVFISRSEIKKVPAISARLKGKPVLTVADFDGTESRDIVVRLFTEKNRVRFRINIDLAKNSALDMEAAI